MFPTPYTVTYKPCTGVTEDDMGNDVAVLGDPVPRKVYGWGEHRARKFAEFTNAGTAGHTSREVADIDLAMPVPATPLNLLDQFTIDDGPPYQVVGIRDNTHGFHGWRPGIVAELKRVKG